MIYICPNHPKNQDDVIMEIKKIWVSHPIPGNYIVNMTITYHCPKCQNEFVKLLAYDAQEEAIV